MPIDPNEAPEGFYAQHSDGSCNICEIKFGSDGCINAECHIEQRNDGTEVIFIKKPQETKTMEDEWETLCADSAENCKIIVDWIFAGQAFLKSMVSEGFSNGPVSWIAKGRVYGRKKSVKKVKKFVDRTEEEIIPLIGRYIVRKKEDGLYFMITSNEVFGQEDMEIAPLGTEEWEPMRKAVECEA